MSTEVIVALITGAFTFAGVVLTVYYGNKKTVMQIQAQAEQTRQKNLAQAEITREKIAQLEKKQDKHNSVIERMYKVEQHLTDIDQRVCNLEDRVN